MFSINFNQFCIVYYPNTILVLDDNVCEGDYDPYSSLSGVCERGRFMFP